MYNVNTGISKTKGNKKRKIIYRNQVLNYTGAAHFIQEASPYHCKIV